MHAIPFEARTNEATKMAYARAPRHTWLGVALFIWFLPSRGAFAALHAALWTVGCWLLAAFPNRVLAHLPNPGVRWLLGVPRASRGDGPQAAAPPLDLLVPANIRVAFQLGELRRQLSSGEAAVDADERATVLAEARRLLQLPPAVRFTSLDLSRVEAACAQAVTRRSRLQNLWGALSVVNIAAALALTGIAVTVVPTAVILLRSSGLLDAVSWLLRHAATLARPILALARSRLPNVAFLLSYYVVAASARFRGGDGAAQRQVATLGATLGGMAIGGVLGEAASRAGHGALPLLLWATSMLVPVAVGSGSTLLGFATVATVYAALGFHVIPVWGGWAVGWRGVDDLYASAAASGVVLLVHSGLLATNITHAALRPFRGGVAVLGTVGLGLAGLIWSSRPYMYNHGLGYTYLQRNAVVAAALLGAATGGAYLRSAGMKNTACVFGCLWLCEKVVEGLGSRLPVPLIFGGSVLLWQATLLLRARPEVLRSVMLVGVDEEDAAPQTPLTPRRARPCGGKDAPP